MTNSALLRRIALTHAAVLLVCGTAAFAMPEAASDKPVAAADKPVAEKKVCKYVSATGSRLATRKICYTAAQWDAPARDASQDSTAAANKASF